MDTYNKLIGLLLLTAATWLVGTFLPAPVMAVNATEATVSAKPVLSILRRGPTATGVPRHARVQNARKTWPKKAAKASRKRSSPHVTELPAARQYQAQTPVLYHPVIVPSRNTMEYEWHVPAGASAAEASSCPVVQPAARTGWWPLPPPPAPSAFPASPAPVSYASAASPCASGFAAVPSPPCFPQAGPAAAYTVPGPTYGPPPSGSQFQPRQSGAVTMPETAPRAANRLSSRHAGRTASARKHEQVNKQAPSRQWNQAAAAGSNHVAPIPIRPTVPPAPPVVQSQPTPQPQEQAAQASRWPHWLEKPYAAVASLISSPSQ